MIIVAHCQMALNLGWCHIIITFTVELLLPIRAGDMLHPLIQIWGLVYETNTNMHSALTTGIIRSTLQLPD